MTKYRASNYDPSTNTIKKSSTRSWDDRRCFLLRFRWISIFFVLLVPLDCFDAFQFLIHSYQTRWSHNSTHNVNKAASYIYLYRQLIWFSFSFRSFTFRSLRILFYFVFSNFLVGHRGRSSCWKKPGSFPYFHKCRPLSRMIITTTKTKTLLEQQQQ